MEFCSKYGYNYGFDGSDEEDFIDNEEEYRERRLKKVRKADTNIISVKFDKLVSPNEMFAGEPKHCKNCGAIMSFLTKENIVKIDEKLTWTCEFCNELNDITNVIDDLNEIPIKDDVTFMLELPKPKEEIKTDEKSIKSNISTKEVSLDDSFLSFCIDISGSMDDRILNNNNEYTGFTRLGGVKSACVDTLKKLKIEEPHRRANLVTFSSEVDYYGDCTNNLNVKINNNEDLSNKERLLTCVNNLTDEVKEISESYNSLESKIKSLSTRGCTALGPGLLFSIGLASKKPGSSVILCTDGCANVGIGNIERRNNEESEKFYEEIANYAKEKGVVVNVISMKGTDCKLALLGKVSDITNGILNIVNPLELGDEFKSILENRILATNVTAKLIVHHKFLYIRDDDLEKEEGRLVDRNNNRKSERIESIKKSIESRVIGNANIDTEITFEYGIRKIHGEKKENIKKLPFQLQITYTRQDGTKAIRVYTKLLEFTTDRNEAEKNITEDGIFLTHNAQKMSKQMFSENMFQTKCRDYASSNLMARNKMSKTREYELFSDKIKFKSKNESSKEMNDDDAQEAYYHAKLSRMKMDKYRMLEEEKREKEEAIRREIEKERRKREREEEEKKKNQSIIVSKADIEPQSSFTNKDDSEPKKDNDLDQVVVVVTKSDENNSTPKNEDDKKDNDESNSNKNSP